MTKTATKKKAPAPELPSREDLANWLLSKHTTLWGQSFMLIKGGQDRAADWILSQLAQYLQWAEEGKTIDETQQQKAGLGGI